MDADPALPGSGVLLGPGARHALAPVATGGPLLDVRATQVRYHPGSRLIVRYAGTVAAANATQRTQTLVGVVQRRRLPADLAVVTTADGGRIGVWRYPHDPYLPGLRAVAGPRGARGVLSGLGLGPWDDQLRVRPLVYRPGSRAVLRVSAGDRTVYLKVVRPGRALRLCTLHNAFHEVTPAPRCLAVSDELGLLALDALPGRALTTPLVNGGRLPAPGQLVALAKGVSTMTLPEDAGPRSAPAQAKDQVRLLATAIPSEAGRLARLGASATDLGGASDRVVHGDLHGAHILVADDGTIRGVLDLDGAGLGSAVEDPATLLGHLVGLAHMHPTAAGRIGIYREELARALPPDVDRQQLHAAVTGVLLGLASTPFRRQVDGWPAAVSRWLGLAEDWVRRPL